MFGTMLIFNKGKLMKMKILYHNEVCGNLDQGYEVVNSEVVYEGEYLSNIDLIKLFGLYVDPRYIDIEWRTEGRLAVDAAGKPAFSIHILD
jgi:hypothetical protein